MFVNRFVNQSFADAEIAEDHVENVLDVDPAGQPAERPGGQPQFLGHQLLAPDGPSAQRAFERADGLLQRPALPLAGDERRFGSRRSNPSQSAASAATSASMPVPVSAEIAKVGADPRSARGSRFRTACPPAKIDLVRHDPNI